MFQIYLGFYVILFLFQGGGSTRIVKDGDDVSVECVPGISGTLTFWFRIQNDGPKFLFTSKNTEVKATDVPENYKVKVSGDKMGLTIQKFNKKKDSGVYTCAGMNNNMLRFGKQTTINGEPDPTTQPPKKAPAPTKAMSDIVATTKTQCACNKKDLKSFLNCETWILSSLASGCGLLLLILVITILYCNRIRTRRCPHHYKRHPQNRPTGHAKLPDSHF
ncbi:T-cell surface glycoprotein CD8 alpha chain isoform X2 [Misgurnus anguillicaudatus]|uniref:T-cell surface glycoprotein CD8 alpha chain isoform X2 n=1 Tax=Misgurnus anguillicaudatus TaxID=75329 RepID=UPI003CCF8046